MRTEAPIRSLTILLGTALLIGAAVLAADATGADAQKGNKRDGAKDKKSDDVLGGYDVRYEEVSSNCDTTSIALARGSLDITKKKSQLVVDIQRFPLMYGAFGRGGKVRATSKIAPSSIQGVDGKFSVAGRVDEGVIQLVFVAEYYVSGKPLCSQTWNVSGAKQK